MLETFHLSKVSGKRPVLNNISIQVMDGDFITMFGDSKSASMLLKSLPGFVRLKRGSIEIDGKTIVSKSKGLCNTKSLYDFCYMSAEGAFLADWSIQKSINEKSSWYKNFQKEAFLSDLKEHDLLDAVKTKCSKVPSPKVGLISLLFGMNLGCKFWLIDLTCQYGINTLSQEKRQKLYERMKKHCEDGGVILFVSEESVLDDLQLYGSNRIMYLYNGGIIADEPFISKNGKSLASRIIEWKRVGI